MRTSGSRRARVSTIPPSRRDALARKLALAPTVRLRSVPIGRLRWVQRWVPILVTNLPVCNYDIFSPLWRTPHGWGWVIFRRECGCRPAVIALVSAGTVRLQGDGTRTLRMSAPTTLLPPGRICFVLGEITRRGAVGG